MALDLLKSSHKGREAGIHVLHYPQRIKKVSDTVYLVKLFIYAAICVTIILGGLGISSVMLAAIQDRTREIGLRKALGAEKWTILLQFLLEAVLISLFSGAIGIVFGFLGVEVLKGMLDVEVSRAALTLSIIQGLLFTVMLGIASGMYPSIKASRMDSVTAMKFE